MEHEREHARTNESPLNPLQARSILGMRVDATTYDADTPAEVGLREGLASRYILGMRVDCTSYADAAGRIVAWGKARRSCYVCASSVNNVMHAHDGDGFMRVMNSADLVTPDGMPLVWGLRLLGVPEATRVYGPHLTEILCEQAERVAIPVGFYGGTPDVLSAVVTRVRERWPKLQIAYSYAPPFRELSPEEDARISANIAASGAGILFVGIGTPKQDVWMHRHRGRLPVAMVGVGAAFDFLAGRKRQAPPLLQRLGLEWLFRLVTEPRRLWKRYVLNNPRFLALFVRQLLKPRFGRTDDRPGEGGKT